MKPAVRMLPTASVAFAIGLIGCFSEGQPRLGPDGNGVPVTVVVMPNSLSAHANELVYLEYYGLDEGGDSIDVTLDWEADGGVVGVNGTFSANSPGVYHVIGRSAAYPFPADTTTVTVTNSPVSLVSISIIPLQPIVAPNSTRPFLADGIYSDSSIGSVAVSWSATGGTITPEGIYTAGATEGSYTVTATSSDGRVSVGTGITVSQLAPTVQRVVLSPDSLQVLRNAGAQFHAFATYSDGSFAPVSAQYTTTSGTITSTGRLTAGGIPGTFKVTATAVQGGMADTAALVVSSSSVQDVSISPPSVALQSGSAQQFSVSARLQDGTMAPVSAEFSATGGTVSSSGLFTAGPAPGVFFVVATNATSGLADTATVAISGAATTLEGVVINPSAASLLPGGRQQFSAVGQLSDGTTAPVLVTWSSTGGQIDASGLLAAPQLAGTYSVIARSAGGVYADTAQVRVSNATQLQRIAISPRASQLVVGALQQYSVTGYLADGSQSNVSVTFSATGGSISPSGAYSAGTTPGDYRVIATLSGGALADTVSVTIIDLPPSGSSACAHEPSGYFVISDQPFTTKPPVAPATDQYGWTIRGIDAFRVSEDSDATAPRSGPKVMRGWFRQGGNGGAAPFKLIRNFDRNYKAIFVCVFTKLDPAYTNNGNAGTKFGFILSPYQGTSQGVGPYFNLTNNLGINMESSGAVLNRNMLSSFNLVNHRGVWHKVEFLVVGNSLGKSDGIARMWVDDAKVLDVTDVQYFFPSQAPAFDGITWNPTYGGGTNPIPYDMYQWVDHWYLSGQ